MGEYVFECVDKNGRHIFPGSLVSFTQSREEKDMFGKVKKAKTYTVCGPVTEIRFDESGCSFVKANGRLEHPNKVTVIEMTAEEQAIASAIRASGGRFDYEQIKTSADALKSLVKTEVLLEMSDARPVETLGLSAILDETGGE